MIRRMIDTLNVVRVYFLFKDCKKMIKKYYGKKADELGKGYRRDFDRLFNKYKNSEKALNTILDTFTLIEAYDKEVYDKSMNDFISLIEEVNNAPSSATNTEQGK